MEVDHQKVCGNLEVVITTRIVWTNYKSQTDGNNTKMKDIKKNKPNNNKKQKREKREI